MTVDFDILKRNELRAAVELVGRAFEDYEYFTNYFQDLEERRRVLRGVVYREFLTNFKKTHYLVAKRNGELVAVAQVNATDYKKPSDFQYLIHGWPLVYLGVNRRRLDDWLAMDAAAGTPCHEYQATGKGIWYLSSITVDPSAQGIGIGTQFIGYMEDFIRTHGGKELVLFTNSDKNIAYYKRCGFEVFDEREFTYNGKTMRSWSVKKTLLEDGTVTLLQCTHLGCRGFQSRMSAHDGESSLYRFRAFQLIPPSKWRERAAPRQRASSLYSVCTVLAASGYEG